MNEYQNLLINSIEFDNSTPNKSHVYKDLRSLNSEVVTPESKIIQLPEPGEIKSSSESFLLKGRKVKIKKDHPDLLLPLNPPATTSPTTHQSPSSLFRLFVKNGEYVYARANDIIMMESCDHLVKVYVAFNDKIKKTIRHNSFKDFLLQLPQEQFMRIGRFCAVNMFRLSGGNCNEQTFEFDFKFSIKLKHAISHNTFNTIGK